MWALVKAGGFSDLRCMSAGKRRRGRSNVRFVQEDRGSSLVSAVAKEDYIAAECISVAAGSTGLWEGHDMTDGRSEVRRHLPKNVSDGLLAVIISCELGISLKE